MDKHMTFYFDIEDHHLVTHLSLHIKNLGGECTSFFSKDVTHLITNRHAAKKGEITITTVPNPVTITPSSTSLFDKSTPGTSSTAIQTSVSGYGGKENTFDENMSDINQSKRSSTAFKLLASNLTPSSNFSPSTLLHHSRTQQKYDLISKANAMNTTIWTVEQLYHYLQRLYAQSSEDLLKGTGLDLKKSKDADLLNCLLAEKRHGKGNSVLSHPSPAQGVDAASLFHRQSLRQSTRLSGTVTSGQSGAKTTSQPLVSQYCVFEHPFVMIEDAQSLHKPLFKEFKPIKPSKTSVFPTLYWNAPTGHCPFIKPSSSSSASASARKKTADHNNTMDHDKPTANAQQQAPVSCRTTPPKKQSPSKPRSKYVKVKRAGYCECCLEKYSDMEDHARQPLHRKFALGKDHFVQLDKLIFELERPLSHASAELHHSATACRHTGTPKSHFDMAMDMDTIAVLDDTLLSTRAKHRLREAMSTNRSGKCRTLEVDVLIKSIEKNESEGESPLCMTPHDETIGPSSPLARKRKELCGRKDAMPSSEVDLIQHQLEIEPEQKHAHEHGHEHEPEYKNAARLECQPLVEPIPIPTPGSSPLAAPSVDQVKATASPAAGSVQPSDVKAAKSGSKCRLVRKAPTVNTEAKRELRTSTLTVSFNSKCGISSPSLNPTSSPKTGHQPKRKLSSNPSSLISSQANIVYYSSEIDEFSFRDVDAMPSCSVPPAKRFFPSLLSK